MQKARSRKPAVVRTLSQRELAQVEGGLGTAGGQGVETLTAGGTGVETLTQAVSPR
jgi:bacteriocin-like protein